MDLSVMDCHADKSARNDRKSGFFTQDSRSCGGGCGFSPPAKAESTRKKNILKEQR